MIRRVALSVAIMVGSGLVASPAVWAQDPMHKMRRGVVNVLTGWLELPKYVQRGKRRLHQNPGAKEIDTCRWWIESERAIVQPKLVLAMGASAARGMLGKTVSISRVRGAPIALEDGSELWVTAHPSYLLRLDGAAREEQARLFDADLAAVRERLSELAG